MRILTLLFLLVLTHTAIAQEARIPRFVSLRSSKINLRAGPGERFPIDWVYKKPGYPVEIIDTYEHWRKIREVDGTQGWVHKTMLSDKRTILSEKNNRTPLYKKPSDSSKIKAYLEGAVILQLHQCKPNLDFCKVSIQDLTGYVKRKNLFGLYENESVLK